MHVPFPVYFAAVRNPYDNHKYLCGALPNGVVLLQWYEPMNKFLQIKVKWILINNIINCCSKIPTT